MQEDGPNGAAPITSDDGRTFSIHGTLKDALGRNDPIMSADPGRSEDPALLHPDTVVAALREPMRRDSGVEDGSATGGSPGHTLQGTARDRLGRPCRPERVGCGLPCRGRLATMKRRAPLR